MNTANHHLVITIHGIRTLGQWQDRLDKLLRLSDPGIRTYNYRYGYFSILAFMIPFLRWLVTRRFRNELEIVLCEQQWDRIDIVAHSFGTHLAGWALRKVPLEKRKAIHTILFAGSVLKSDFAWRNLLEGQTTRVVNECGIRDSVLVWNQLFILFSGMAGRVGFTGMTSERLVNRYHNIGHSGYFLHAGNLSDEFMKQNWIPLLTTTTPPLECDERQVPSPLGGLVIWILNHAEPIKLGIYSFLMALPAVVFFSLYADADAQRRMATARELVLHVRVLMPTKPDIALLLAVHANNVTRPYDSTGIKERLLHLAAPFALKNNQTIRAALWDTLQTQAYYLDKILHFHSGAVPGVAFSPNSTTLASASLDKKVRLWNFENSALSHTMDQSDEAAVVAFNADGSMLAAAGKGEIALWDPKTGTRIKTFPTETITRFLAFTPDANYLFAVDIDGDVYSWDLSKPNDKSIIPTNGKKFIYQIALSPDGNYLAMSSDDGIMFWLLKEHSFLNYLIPQSGFAIAMVFSHDSKFLFWGDISQKDYKIRIWNLGEHRLENQRLEGHEGHTGPVRALAITAADNLLASAAADKTVRLWRIIPSEDGSTPSLEELGPPIVHPAAIFGLSVSHDGKNLAVGSESHTIFLYDLTRQAQVPIGVAWSQWAYGTSLYHDVLAVVGGKQLDGIYAEVIQLWDVSRRHLLMESPLRTYEKYRPTYVAKVQFSADGRTLTLLGDQGVSVIDATSLTETSHPFSLADLGIHGVYRGRGPLEEPELMEPPKFGTIALSSDGRLLARVDSKVRVWDTVTKQLLADIPIEKPSFHATFDSSGKYFATIIDDEIHIWKTDSFGNSLPSKFTIRAGKEVENIAFAPNSKTIAADLGLTLAVWDLEPAEPKLLWQVSEDQEVGDILFSASSARLISLEKTRLRIWETNTGRLVDQLRMPSDKHSNFDQAIYLTDDVLVTINQNGFKHFDLDVKPWSSRACGIVGRQLTQKEWNYFIGETVPFENTCP